MPDYRNPYLMKRKSPRRKGKLGWAQTLLLEGGRYGFIVLLSMVLGLIFQESWLNDRDYIAMERTRLMMASITPTPTLPPTPAPDPTPTPQGPTASPTAEPTPTPRVYVVNSKFTGFLKTNPDTVGWITVGDTPIDYPVVQGDDNEHYLDYSFEGDKSKAGTIFLDYRCSILSDFSRHLILYGHHMKNGTMFKGIIRYKEEDFFLNHRVITFDTLYDDMQWEVFSAYITTVEDPYIRTSFESDSEWLAYIQGFQSKSKFPTPDVVLTADDIVLSLSTCTYEAGYDRFVVHARLIREPEETP